MHTCNLLRRLHVIRSSTINTHYLASLHPPCGESPLLFPRIPRVENLVRAPTNSFLDMLQNELEV